jgi:hypothetical protein
MTGEIVQRGSQGGEAATSCQSPVSVVSGEKRCGLDVSNSKISRRDSQEADFVTRAARRNICELAPIDAVEPNQEAQPIR